MFLLRRPNNYSRVVNFGMDSKGRLKIKLDSTQLIKNSSLYRFPLKSNGRRLDAEMEKAETELSSLNQAIHFAERDFKRFQRNIQAARLQVVELEKINFQKAKID